MSTYACTQTHFLNFIFIQNVICPPQVNVYFCCSCQILSFGAIIVLAIEIRHFSNVSYDACGLYCAVFHSSYVSSRVVRAYSQSETANQFDHFLAK